MGVAGRMFIRVTGDPYALAAAIERVLFEEGLAERLGAAAHESASRWHSTPDEYAERMRELVG